MDYSEREIVHRSVLRNPTRVVLLAKAHLPPSPWKRAKCSWQITILSFHQTQRRYPPLAPRFLQDPRYYAFRHHRRVTSAALDFSRIVRPSHSLPPRGVRPPTPLRIRTTHPALPWLRPWLRRGGDGGRVHHPVRVAKEERAHQHLLRNKKPRGRR